MTLQELRAAFGAAERAVITFRGSVRRLQPDVIDRHVKDRFEELSTTNEAIRRLPRSERDRIKADIKQETIELRRAAAQVARHHAAEVRAFITEARHCIECARRNTEQSFPPDVYHHVTADGLITLGLLRVHLRSQLAQADATALHSAYGAALARKDAAGLVEAEIIEAIVMSNRKLATTKADIPAAKQLREYVEGMIELRTPPDLPDLDTLQREASRLSARADLLRIAPLNPHSAPLAASAFDQEQGELFMAGEKSLADYASESMQDGAS